MSDILTLGMREATPGKFQVIGLKKNPTEIISIDLAREDIISETGKPFWDIGYVTEVEHLNKNSKMIKNVTYKVFGTAKMRPESKMENFKKYFEKESKKIQEFFNSQDQMYGIAKVEQIISLSEKIDYNNRINDKFNMELIVQGVPPFKTKHILNKDYRWKKYWQKMYDTHHLEETKERYIKLFNESERDLYIILYRHQYDDGPQIWIAGIHWL